MFYGQNAVLCQNLTLHNIFIGNNYTPYTIVYNWFYLIYTRKIPVLIHFNWLQNETIQTDLDLFFVGFGGFGLFFCISILCNWLQLQFVKK